LTSFYSSCSQTTQKSNSKTTYSTPTLQNSKKYITPARDPKKADFLTPEDAKPASKQRENENKIRANSSQKRDVHKYFNKGRSTKIEERKDYEKDEEIDEIHMIVKHEMELDQQFITQTR
jgi:spermidine/putrescine-binding protein